MNYQTIAADEYRKRATQAEQENARLRELLNKKPSHSNLVKTIKEMLKMDVNSTDNQIIAKIKVLRDNQELYKKYEPERTLSEARIKEIMNSGSVVGKRLVIESLEKFISSIK